MTHSFQSNNLEILIMQNGCAHFLGIYAPITKGAISFKIYVCTLADGGLWFMFILALPNQIPYNRTEPKYKHFLRMNNLCPWVMSNIIDKYHNRFQQFGW